MTKPSKNKRPKSGTPPALSKSYTPDKINKQATAQIQKFTEGRLEQLDREYQLRKKAVIARKERDERELQLIECIAAGNFDYVQEVANRITFNNVQMANNIGYWTGILGEQYMHPVICDLLHNMIADNLARAQMPGEDQYHRLGKDILNNYKTLSMQNIMHMIMLVIKRKLRNEKNKTIEMPYTTLDVANIYEWIEAYQFQMFEHRQADYLNTIKEPRNNQYRSGQQNSLQAKMRESQVLHKRGKLG